MSHTPEPWKVLNDSELTPADVWIVPIYHDQTDHAIAEMSAAYDCIPDAKRIVAAVNAVAGIPQQVLTQTTPEEMKAFVLNGIANKGLNPAAYRKCVEALTTLRSKYEPTKSNYGFVTKEDLAKVDAALAAAQGTG